MSAVTTAHDEPRWRTLKLRLVATPSGQLAVSGLLPLVRAVVLVGTDRRADASLVVVSRASSADPSWQAALQDEGVGRLVPLAIDATTEGLPEQLQTLNWIP